MEDEATITLGRNTWKSKIIILEEEPIIE